MRERSGSDRWLYLIATLTVGAVILLVSGEALNAQTKCGATWTTACASVSTASSGNTLVLGVSNSSSGSAASNSLLDWFEFTVGPDANVISSQVLTDCPCETALTDPSSCTDITSEWKMKTNDMGGIDWEAGQSTKKGTDGIITTTGTCDGDCWTEVCFVATFDDAVSLDDYAAHMKRLGPGGEDSDWTTTVVPEPVTTTLMTLGVAGWAAAHARRRRQDALELEEDDDRIG